MSGPLIQLYVSVLTHLLFQILLVPDVPVLAFFLFWRILLHTHIHGLVGRDRLFLPWPEPPCNVSRIRLVYANVKQFIILYLLTAGCRRPKRADGFFSRFGSRFVITAYFHFIDRFRHTYPED